MSLQLQDFQARVFGDNGLARSNKWIVTIYPPRGLTSSGAALGNLLSNGNNVNINLPILDAADQFVNNLNNFPINLGGININTNFNIPTLGYALTNLSDRDIALNLFTSSVTLPARDVETSTWKEYGEKRTFGYNHVYGDVELEYYCSNDHRERKFFEQWTEVVYNNVQGGVAYYDNYISRVDIYQYDWQFQNKTAGYRLSECWPSSVGAFNYSHEDGDLLKLKINLKFRRYDRLTL